MADVIQKLKELDKERAGLLDSAKKEALSKATEAVAALNSLGFNYQLAEGGKRVSRKATGQIKDGPCPVCKFKTTPPHDARKHRSQGKKKKPFTSQQLVEFGLGRA
jgi:DNA repair exonuclease SbcCD ATPase subunit